MRPSTDFGVMLSLSTTFQISKPVTVQNTPLEALVLGTTFPADKNLIKYLSSVEDEDEVNIFTVQITEISIYTEIPVPC